MTKSIDINIKYACLNKNACTISLTSKSAAISDFNASVKITFESELLVH